MAKQKTEKKVVITKEHYDALELLAHYGCDLLENRPPTITKGTTLLDAANRAISWASDIDGLMPNLKDKVFLKKIDAAIRFFSQGLSPEDYVESTKTV